MKDDTDKLIENDEIDYEKISYIFPNTNIQDEKNALSVFEQTIPSSWSFDVINEEYGTWLDVKLPGRIGMIQKSFIAMIKSVDRFPFLECSIESSQHGYHDDVFCEETYTNFAYKVPFLLFHYVVESQKPCLLFLVSKSTQKIYWICLTDYLEIIIRKKYPTWYSKTGYAIIDIPRRNNIGSQDDFAQFIDSFAERYIYACIYHQIRVQIAELRELSPLIKRYLDRKIPIQSDPNTWINKLEFGNALLNDDLEAIEYCMRRLMLLLKNTKLALSPHYIDYIHSVRKNKHLYDKKRKYRERITEDEITLGRSNVNNLMAVFRSIAAWGERESDSKIYEYLPYNPTYSVRYDYL